MAVRRDAYASPIKPTCLTAFGVGWRSQGIGNAWPSPEGRALLKPPNPSGSDLTLDESHSADLRSAPKA
jgi:hypothetical protein